MNDLLLLLLPGAMYFWILFIGQGPMQEMLQEKETLILPRILSCPVTPRQYVVAKMLRCFVLCSVAAILLIAASSLLFGIQWGNPLKLALVVITWSWSMTGLLGLVFTIARTREQANVLSPLVLMFFAMLGGSMFPYENLPGFLQLIGQYTPNRWAVLTLQGVARAKPLVDLVQPFAALAMLGAAGCVTAWVLLARRLARGGHQ